MQMIIDTLLLIVKKVLVFDYTGSLVAHLNLDCRIQGMAVWDKGLRLFGISQDPDIS